MEPRVPAPVSAVSQNTDRVPALSRETERNHAKG